MGFDILVTNKFAKYINLACILLLAINDNDSLLYVSVLSKLHRLNKFCKSRVMSFVRFQHFFRKFLKILIKPVFKILTDFFSSLEITPGPQWFFLTP